MHLQESRLSEDNMQLIISKSAFKTTVSTATYEKALLLNP
jgi:hypothetical protein